jgi:hypothetical protein
MATKTKPQVVTKIDNTSIAKMFLADADDYEVEEYYRRLNVPVRGHGLACMYASKKVTQRYFELLSNETGMDYTEIMYAKAEDL